MKYLISNVSLCVSVSACLIYYHVSRLDQRQREEPVSHSQRPVGFSLPICQTHHVWQKIRCLVSLHLAVTLATAAEVNCQLG